MEDKHSKTLLKPTPGIQMLPADLVVRSFTDFLNDNLEPISASANSNIYYFRKRTERFYSCETRLILSRQAMVAFARSGKLPDQFFACRPFDQEERLEILQYLLECMDSPQVSILFEQSNLSKNLTFEAYGRYGTLIYPSQTSYNVENDAYRELILPGTAWADLFYQFAEEVVIPDYCCSTLETRRLIIHLISELQSYHTGS